MHMLMTKEDFWVSPILNDVTTRWDQWEEAQVVSEFDAKEIYFLVSKYGVSRLYYKGHNKWSSTYTIRKYVP